MSMSQNKFPATIIIILVLAAALFAGIYLRGTHNDGLSRQELQSRLQTATLYPDTFRPVASFRLTDHNGASFDNTRLSGQWSLLFFGYTYCPDICPLTLMTLKNINGKLSTAAPDIKLNTVFVSVDPERDTTERLKQYVTYFNPAFIGVSGDMENLQTLSKSVGAFFTRDNTGADEYYDVDHTASLFLFNPDGKIHALFSAPHDPEFITGDIIKIYQHWN